MILVTGGTGLVGSHLLLRLVTSGRRPRATYRDENKIALTQKVFAYYRDDYQTLFEKIEWVQCDILDIPALEKTFKGVSKVYHAAAFISFEPKDYQKLLKINIEGTANIVNLCIANQIEKLCYVSSIAAIGDSVGDIPVTESNEWNSVSTSGYAVSKYAAEMEVWRGSQEGIPVVIVNPGVILGPGFWKSGSGLFFYAAWKESKYYLPNGTGFVSVNDVVGAMMRLMASQIQNERFILVNENWTYQHLSQVLANGLQKKAPQKELDKWMLDVLWRIDWLKSNVTGSRRKLSKSAAKMLGKHQIYDNSKIKELAPDFKYEDLSKAILNHCSFFLREQG